MTAPTTISQKPAQAQRTPTSGCFSADFGDGVAEAHGDQRRKDVAHDRAVRGERAIVPFWIADPGVQAGCARTSARRRGRARARTPRRRARNARGSSFLFTNTAQPPAALRLGRELRFVDHLDLAPHAFVAEAAEFLAGHQVVAGLLEAHELLGDVARHQHGVDVGALDRNPVNHVGAGGAEA